MSLSSKQLIKLEEKHSAKNYAPLDVVISRGEGVWVYDVEGKKYMDFLSAYSALNQGHVHPEILEVVKRQASRLTLTSRAFRNDQFGLFCQEICKLAGYEMALPMNSGAEAVETALKAARKWGYQVKGVAKNKAEIIVCKNNFHGRTISIISFSSVKQYQDGFGPFTPGFKIVEYGDNQAVRQAITKNTVAVMIEPVQGEGGILIPPPGYLTSLAATCKDKNVLLIVKFHKVVNSNC